MIDGDMDAFARLYERYRDLTVKCAARRFPASDLALDVSQEAFLQLLRKPPRQLRNGSLAGWLRRVTENKAIDRMRRQNRHEVRLDSVAELPMETRTPLSEILAVENDAMLAQMQAQLSDEYRRLIHQHFYLKYPFSRIAAESGIPLSTAIWRLNHALRLLQSMYNHSGQSSLPPR